MYRECFDNNWRKQFIKLGPRMNAEEIVTVGSRLVELTKLSWNNDEIILLAYDSRFPYLYFFIHS